MLSSLRIIHPPSSDNPTNLPVLVLSIDSKRFIFNAPEGLTRILVQRGSRGASKGLHGVFVPRVGCEECGGLPGLLMTLSDRDKNELSLYGPPVLKQLIATSRAYARRNGFRLDVHEAKLAHDYEKTDSTDSHMLYSDKDVAIKAIPLYPAGFRLPNETREATTEALERPSKKSKKLVSDNDIDSLGALSASKRVEQCLSLMFDRHGTEDDEAHNDNVEDGADEMSSKSSRHEKQRAAWATVGSSMTLLDKPPLSPVPLNGMGAGQAPTLLFTVEGSMIRGKFDVQKARALGVPQPSMYSILASGQDLDIQRPKAWMSWSEKEKQRWLAAQPKSLNGNSKHQNAKKKGLKDERNTKAQEYIQSMDIETVKVRSEEVVAPSQPGTAFAQIYLPSVDYLPSFLSTETQKHLEALRDRLHVVVHAVHPDVLEDSRYQDFFKRFDAAHHLIASRQFVPDKLAYSSAALAALRMSYLDDKLFRVPQYSLESERPLSDVNLGLRNIGVTGLETEIPLHPRKEPSHSSSLPFVPDFEWPLDSIEAKEAASFRLPARNASHQMVLQHGRERWQKYLELVDHLQEEETKRNSLDMDNQSNKDTIHITTLGTGSASPSQYRNVSATLVHLPRKQGFVLLDAGEGTYGQLCRRFGKDVDNVLRNIRLIFLSHIHGDHHMGMTRLLYERAKLKLQRPLFVITSTYLRNYLLEANDIQQLDICPPDQAATAKSGVVFLENEHFDARGGVKAGDEAWHEKLEEDRQRKLRNTTTAINSNSSSNPVADVIRWRTKDRNAVRAQLDHLEQALHGTQVFTAEVDHRIPHCYGVVLRNAEWSVAYSGDTRPCESLIQAGRDVDVLIHEATFEDGEEEMAHRKGHSTVGQAINAACQMNARRVLLTHFSQRYPKLPRVADTFAESDNGKETVVLATSSASAPIVPSVGVAFDLMTVAPSDIGKTERYREALHVLFDDAGDEHEAGADDDIASETGTAATNGATQKSAQNQRSGMDDVDKSTKDSKAKDREAADGKNARDKRFNVMQRKFVKDHDLVFVVAQLMPVMRGRRQELDDRANVIVPPNRIGFMEALGSAMEDLHGHVGASFHRDLVIFSPVAAADPANAPAATEEAEQRTRSRDLSNVGAMYAVIKCASSCAQTLTSTLATGFAVNAGASSAAGQAPVYTTQCMGILHSLDLVALHAMVTGNGTAMKPAGRAWLESL